MNYRTGDGLKMIWCDEIDNYNIEENQSYKDYTDEMILSFFEDNFNKKNTVRNKSDTSEFSVYTYNFNNFDSLEYDTINYEIKYILGPMTGVDFILNEDLSVGCLTKSRLGGFFKELDLGLQIINNNITQLKKGLLKYKLDKQLPNKQIITRKNKI